MSETTLTKIWIRKEFLKAIDEKADELNFADEAERLLWDNQRNRVAVFLGESKHKFDLKRL